MAVTDNSATPTQATAERVFLIGLMAASAALFYETLSYPLASRIFPAALLVLLFAMCAIGLVRSLRQPGESGTTPFFDHAPRFALVLGVLVAYTLVLEHVGYYTMSVVMIVLLPALLGYRNWRVILATAVLYVLFVWLTFNVIFQRDMAREFFMPWIMGY